MSVTLSSLLSDVDTLAVHGDVRRPVTTIVADSRQVTPGACFVAVRGVNVDGHRFIPQALDRGGHVVVGEVPPDPGWLTRATYVQVPNSRTALAQLAAAWYRHPSTYLLVVGITGTDGKTTTSTLISSVLTAAGYRTGLITTTGARIGDADVDTGLHVTTPDASDVQRYLRQMVDAGMTAAVLECTSHGLDQRRVDAVAFDVAVVTNVTHEHLDYHGSWEAYLAAKTRLFDLAARSPRKAGIPKVAVLNRNDRSYAHLRGVTADQVLTYGRTANADVWTRSVEFATHATRLTVQTPQGALSLRTRLVGDFNVDNVLAAVAAAVALDLPSRAIQEGVAAVEGVRGRMERIDLGQDFLAIVDFAHSPASLERALITLRDLMAQPGRLIAVFGSAGLRDRSKRYLMGEIGARLADAVILTAEDPRTESLAEILAEMARGAVAGGGREGETFWRVPDRQEAILQAVMMAEPGDVVAVFGKGHERSMCFGQVEYPWGDQEALAWALRVRLYGPEAAGTPPFRLPTGGERGEHRL